MRPSSARLLAVSTLLFLSALPVGALADQILKTDGFSSCLADAELQVQRMNIQYNKDTRKVDFDVAGSSSKTQNVTASLIVTAYGRNVYQKDFNPCEKDTFVQQLCPVPAGTFAAAGSQSIPSEYADMIPSIAFSVPDLDGQAKLELKSLDTGKDLACITSTVNNGKSMNVPGVSYFAAGLAGAALILSGLSALGSAGHAGASTSSPTFLELMGWFQSMAMNGMMSVKYPGVYQSFAKNFAFSGGLVYWEGMQVAIDNFRKSTGGNLTEDSVEYLKGATLIYTDGSTSGNITKRAIDDVLTATSFYVRQVSTIINGTSSSIGEGNSTNPAADKAMHVVHGIQGYVEQLTIPQSNTFMTVLLIFAIVIAAITVGILLFKVILEAWALFGSFPKRLTGFRKRYWWLLAKTITNLILLLYGIWTLYCVYQFTNGDSWAAKVLAGVTLAAFTAILAAFTFRIWQIARKYKKAAGDTSALFENKETWRKYSLFYENYKRSYWWIFVPSIVYMFAKGCIIAGADGHGLVQTAGQLIVESLLLILLLWSRPYSLKSGNWINIIIQVVRVLSVVCILVFVEELGIAQDTKTITGLVLIVMQSVLTGLLAILIAINAIVLCCKENPHRRRRKEAEKLNRDLDNLTPLDARNSLLMDPTTRANYAHRTSGIYKAPLVSPNPFASARTAYDPVSQRDMSPPPSRPPHLHAESQSRLMSSAASMGRVESRSRSPPFNREPRLPDVEFGYDDARGRRY